MAQKGAKTSTPTTPVSMEPKLTAILRTDVTGYSRLMGKEVVATIRTLTAYREVIAILNPASSRPHSGFA